MTDNFLMFRQTWFYAGQFLHRRVPSISWIVVTKTRARPNVQTDILHVFCSTPSAVSHRGDLSKFFSLTTQNNFSTIFWLSFLSWQTAYNHNLLDDLFLVQLRRVLLLLLLIYLVFIIAFLAVGALVIQVPLGERLVDGLESATKVQYWFQCEKNLL